MKVEVGDKSGFVVMDLRILAFYKISSTRAISSASFSVTYLYFFVLVKLLDADLLLWFLRIEKSLKTLSSLQSAFRVLFIQSRYVWLSRLDRVWKEAFWSRAVQAKTS